MILGSIYCKYGISMFVDRSYFDLNLSPSEWRSIMKDKTVLLIGGPHRGGTTIIWKAITQHPLVAGFGSTFESGADHSEGILIQDVYPQFGVGMEKIMANMAGFKTQMIGAGKYALGDEAKVHLIETDEKVTPSNMAKLLNRFGSYWNLTKPVLAEKSPPTAVMSRFLQALYNVPVIESEAQGTHLTKFLFITRHPIANVYAHYSLVGGSHVVPFDTLMENYMQLHRYLKSDLPHLHNDPMLIRLEDFVTSPSDTLHKIFSWLGIDASEATTKDVLTRTEVIHSDPNAKYRKKWCGIHPKNRADVEGKYQLIVDDLDLGYSLKGWCKEDQARYQQDQKLQKVGNTKSRMPGDL
uniref:Protein-tyrosine sulfotransferase n=1 Tax=Fibrocapsa japonica TaxID=94617 RepID=A0A7S2V2M0_9STRA